VPRSVRLVCPAASGGHVVLTDRSTTSTTFIINRSSILVHETSRRVVVFSDFLIVNVIVISYSYSSAVDTFHGCIYTFIPP
jgi:hypothetical protein